MSQSMHMASPSRGMEVPKKTGAVDGVILPPVGEPPLLSFDAVRKEKGKECLRLADLMRNIVFEYESTEKLDTNKLNEWATAVLNLRDSKTKSIIQEVTKFLISIKKQVAASIWGHDLDNTVSNLEELAVHISGWIEKPNGKYLPLFINSIGSLHVVRCGLSAVSQLAGCNNNSEKLTISEIKEIGRRLMHQKEFSIELHGLDQAIALSEALVFSLVQPIRNAKSSTAFSLNIKRSDEYLWIYLIDNGKGFEIENTTSANEYLKKLALGSIRDNGRVRWGLRICSALVESFDGQFGIANFDLNTKERYGPDSPYTIDDLKPFSGQFDRFGAIVYCAIPLKNASL